MADLSHEERRALEALGCHPDGCDEAVLLADGATVGQLAGLVIDGLATMQATHLPLNGREKPVLWMKITDTGRNALANSGLRVKLARPGASQCLIPSPGVSVSYRTLTDGKTPPKRGKDHDLSPAPGPLAIVHRRLRQQFPPPTRRCPANCNGTSKLPSRSPSTKTATPKLFAALKTSI